MNAKELENKFTPDNETIALFKLAIEAEALVKVMKEKYEPVYTEIFNKYNFVDKYDKTKITKRIDVYADADNDKCNKYFKECNEVLFNTYGYEKAKDGICPILEAESLMRDANRGFAESVFNELETLGIMKGVKFENLLYSLSNYKKFLELSKQLMFTKGITVEA